MQLSLLFATNRAPRGRQDAPSGYSGRLTRKHWGQDLRFGVLRVQVPQEVLLLPSGQAMSAALLAHVRHAQLQLYPESIAKNGQESASKLGSAAMFAQLHQRMLQSTDVLLYVHGFNMGWDDAVADALALEVMLNRSVKRDPQESVMVVLFSWPSDGLAVPMLSYLSDRADARTSGLAMGRGFLKFRDFLIKLRQEVVADQEKRKKDQNAPTTLLCQQEVHLLCHSMGNYLLQKAIEQLDYHTPGFVLPRIFDQIFMCAPDVDDTILEPGQPLAKLAEVAQGVTVYHNARDAALMVSDKTKGNPERLGTHGAAHPATVHHKVHQVDCQPTAQGGVQHSYFLDSPTVDDIRQSIDGLPLDDAKRQRRREGLLNNVWQMTPLSPSSGS